MRKISRLLIVCMLLVGCAKPEAVMPVALPPTDGAVSPGLYDAGSNLEISSSGAVRTYPLGNRTGKHIFSFGEDVLLLSDGDTTLLTLFSGDALVPTAERSLSFSLDAKACVVGLDTLSFFDPSKNQTLVLGRDLETLKTIPAPVGLVGYPLLTADGSRLFYCTQTAVRVLELDSGISRTLKETQPSQKVLSSICCDGTVLRYESQDQSFFLSTQTGELLGQAPGSMQLFTVGTQYAALLWETNLWSLIFDLDSSGQKALTPRDLSAQYDPVIAENALVTSSLSGDVVSLDHYDLTTGLRTAAQMYRGGLPLSLFSREREIFFLAHLQEYEGLAICRWKTAQTAVSDPASYIGQRFTADRPDQAGLQQCQVRAQALGAQYGLEILVWEDALRAIPQGYEITPEHRVNILNRELELLEQWLRQFPTQLLEATASNFDTMALCLVSKIQGEVHSPGSLQFFDGSRAYILLEAGTAAEQGLYHNLFHVMETHILGHSSAFDRWDTLNPQGFRYDYSYAANAIRNSGIYLTEENRSFIDTFSMSYPKEDRARIWEYAMLADSGSLFRSQAMQRKLAALCTGIRQAYGLEESFYLWEQHLT